MMPTMEQQPEVYRRRKTSKVELDRQRVVIARRKVSVGQSSIHERIMQYKSTSDQADTTYASNNNSTPPPRMQTLSVSSTKSNSVRFEVEETSADASKNVEVVDNTSATKEEKDKEQIEVKAPSQIPVKKKTLSGGAFRKAAENVIEMNRKERFKNARIGFDARAEKEKGLRESQIQPPSVAVNLARKKFLELSRRNKETSEVSNNKSTLENKKQCLTHSHRHSPVKKSQVETTPSIQRREIHSQSKKSESNLVNSANVTAVTSDGVASHRMVTKTESTVRKISMISNCQINQLCTSNTSTATKNETTDEKKADPFYNKDDDGEVADKVKKQFTNESIEDTEANSMHTEDNNLIFHPDINSNFHNISGICEDKKSKQEELSTDICTHNEGVLKQQVVHNFAVHNKTQSELDYTALRKRRVEQLQSRDRSNTWTTSDSKSDSGTGAEIDVDTSDLSPTQFEEKEPHRRRKLVKRRSRKNREKNSIRSKNGHRQFDTSDGDAIESNYTSDDCKSRGIVSSSDIKTSYVYNSEVNVLNNNKGANDNQLLSEEKENNEKLNSSYSKLNNSKDESSQQSIKGKVIFENKSRILNYNNIRSSSMTAVSRRPNLHSFSTSDMGGFGIEEDTNSLVKLENFKRYRQGSLGSFTNISKVSALKLQSFTAKPQQLNSLSQDGTHCSNNQPNTSSYTELTEAHQGFIKPSPFSCKKMHKELNLSDGEHELTMRLEKISEAACGSAGKVPFKKSYTLPRNMRFNQDLDITGNPFSLQKRTQAEEEESARAAKVLDSLPSSPFTLIGRFTEDTKKMQINKLGTKDHHTSFSDHETDSSQKHLNEHGTTEDLPGTLINNIAVRDSSTVQDSMSNNDGVVNSANRKIKSRPTMNISSLSTVTDNIDVDEVDEDGNNSASVPRRRASYLIAQNSDDEDQLTLLSKTAIDNHSEAIPDEDKQKRSAKLARPRLPVMLVENTEDEVSPIVLDKDNESDSDCDKIDFIRNVGEKGDNKRPRVRPYLTQPPMLAGIPEERGNINRQHDRKRRGKAILPGVFPEDTINEEPCETEFERNDEKETGYFSQGSDLLSTPKDLSIEDIPFELEGEKYLEKADVLPPVESPKLIAPPQTLNTSASDSMLSKKLVKTSSSLSLSSEKMQKMPDGEASPPPLSSTPTLNTTVTGKKKTPKPEMRQYVLQNLLDTERSYVQNLSTMLTKFSEPLKRPENSHIIETSLVDEIFHQVPEILENHEIFLDQLTERVSNWDDQQVIGDIFISSFTKCFLMDAYSSFINHFVQAKAAIRQAMNARPQFNRFIEQCSREHKEKLTLSDLLITPVQRIPRYKLLLLDMFKYTPDNHPDYENLLLAISEIETLADRMNKGEMEADQIERDNERLRDIEGTIEGIQDLVTSSRKFIRQDLVAEKEGLATKKDRCLFLFSDLLVCTTVRRKNNALRRGSLGLFTGQSAAELNRYKFQWKLQLEDVEISKGNNPQSTITNSEIEKLEDDIQTLETMTNHAESLSIPHQTIDVAMKELIIDVRQLIQEKQIQASVSQFPAKIELMAQTDEGSKYYTFIFLSAECKSSWGTYFEDAKQKLANSFDSFPPEFQCPMPITKTRSGMQFTCAAPSHTVTSYDTHHVSRDVWVCNSDGYVGQVCLLTMVPETQSKASLSVCSARIVCIAAVPGGKLLRTTKSTTSGKIDFNPRKIKPRHSPRPMKHKKSFHSESDDEDSLNNAAAEIMAFDSSDEEDMGSPQFMIGSTPFDGRMSPDGSSLGTAESQEGERSSDDDYNNFSDEDERKPIQDRTTFASDISFNADVDDQPTMWLGTEDGHVYVYNALDTITQRKSKMKIQLNATVTAILYLESKVFVALGSGELCIYTREKNTNVWQISSPQSIQVSITGSPIACMTSVAGRIWCGCQNTIVLVNASTLRLETTIEVSGDHNRSVHKIVSSGLGVWVSMLNSAIVRLYHATTYENVADIDVTPAVQKMLAGADAIIRQHKSACLKVTAILICKDLLWIGTSAGVILTNPLPPITASTSALKHSPGPTGSPHGHTGHVRFLTLVEVPKSQFRPVDYDKERTSPWLGGSGSSKMRRRQTNSKHDTNGTVTLVLSGGDGYEDFRYGQQTDSVGQTDSTNHLLIWHV